MEIMIFPISILIDWPPRGLGDLWIKAHHVDIGIINIIGRRLKDIQLQRWLSKIDNHIRKDANQGNKRVTSESSQSVLKQAINFSDFWIQQMCFETRNEPSLTFEYSK